MEKRIKESKYRYIGYLIKYKLGYSKFESYQIEGHSVVFSFINKEGFPRYWQTTLGRIRLFKEKDVTTLFAR